MTVSLPYPNLKAGDSIIAGQLKLNFNALVTEVNGNLTTSSLSPNAGIVDTQLAQITTASKVANSALSINPLLYKEVIFLIDGAGSTITTGIKGDIRIPFAGTITGAYLFADQSGSIVIDLWKDTQANFPPTVADTITASAKPTLSSATNVADTTLTGWTTAVSAGDIIRVNVDSVSTVTRVSLALTLTRTA